MTPDEEEEFAMDLNRAFDRGYDEGFKDGKAAGFADGWDSAVAASGEATSV